MKKEGKVQKLVKQTKNLGFLKGVNTCLGVNQF